jgi:hypothetical protein
MKYPKPIKFSVELNDDEALAFAQFLKRAGVSEYRIKAVSDNEAYLMHGAASKIQNALADQGFSPR